MDLFERLTAVSERWNVLRHPFYAAWSSGELTRDDLAYYAGEYRHAVVALADASAAAAADEPDLAPHAAEERSHVRLWDMFALELDADTARPPRAETKVCVEAWTSGADLVENLAVLYATESAQPAISQTKLAGLIEHYGFEDGSGTAYFSLHAERDVEHAAEARALLEERATESDADRVVAAAERALQGNWLLLDGVEQERVCA